MMIRIARSDDIPGICAIYDAVHDAEDAGTLHVGWQRGIYPVQKTAEDALARGDLYVLQGETGMIEACAVINHIQLDVYALCSWKYQAAPDQVLVLHTLAVHPACLRRGHGRSFVRFYEEEAARQGCTCLRMDTQEFNAPARRLYASLGYEEPCILTCPSFNGIAGVRLVCLEKKL